MPADPTPDDLVLVRRDDLRDLLLDAVTLQKLTTHEQRQAMWAAVNAPVSPVVPLTRLREWIADVRLRLATADLTGEAMGRAQAVNATLDALTALLNEYERTTDGD